MSRGAAIRKPVTLVAKVGSPSSASSRPPAVNAGLPLPCSNPERSHHLVGPDFKADQRVRPESLGNRNVGGVAALGDQDAADPRYIVARIEGVPAAADKGL